MSQRQLAQQSGVDHSTISRLIRGDRMPSLGTATKLARGLRELREDADTAQYLGLVTAGAMNPTARVEYALRADEMLSEPQVRQIMEYYLAVRMRRFGRAFQPSEGPVEPAAGATRRSIAAVDRRTRRRRRRTGHDDRHLRRVDPSAGPWAARVVRRRPPTDYTSGLDPDRPPRPGLGDSEGRRLGRRPSLSCVGTTAVAPGRRRAALPACAPRSRAFKPARSGARLRLALHRPCATNAVGVLRARR